MKKTCFLLFVCCLSTFAFVVVALVLDDSPCSIYSKTIRLSYVFCQRFSNGKSALILKFTSSASLTMNFLFVLFFVFLVPSLSFSWLFYFIFTSILVDFHLCSYVSSEQWTFTFTYTYYDIIALTLLLHAYPHWRNV